MDACLHISLRRYHASLPDGVGSSLVCAWPCEVINPLHDHLRNFAPVSAKVFLRTSILARSSFLISAAFVRNSRARSRFSARCRGAPGGSCMRCNIHASNSSESATTGLRGLVVTRLTGSPLRSQRWTVRKPNRRYLEISFQPVRITDHYFSSTEPISLLTPAVANVSGQRSFVLLRISAWFRKALALASSSFA